MILLSDRKKKNILNFYEVFCAKDVTFLPEAHFGGLIREGKLHFLEKHNQSGIKAGAAVLPNTLEISEIRHNSGSVSGIKPFQGDKKLHLHWMEKQGLISDTRNLRIHR